MHCMVQPMYTRLLLGFTLVMCYTATWWLHRRSRQRRRFCPKKTPTRRTTLLGRLSCPCPRQAGRRFRYERDRDDMYRIIPTDGSPTSLVSASFLQVTLDSPQLDSFQQAELLRSYPALMQEMFTSIMAQMYPDGTTAYEMPFPDPVVDGHRWHMGLLGKTQQQHRIRVRLGGGGGRQWNFRWPAL